MMVTSKLTGRGGPGRGQGRKAKPEKTYKSVPLKLPPDLIEWLRNNVENRNGFIVEAIREKVAMKKQNRKKCHDCGVLEGQVHHPGCDMECCPFCGEQLIGCTCCYRELGLYDRAIYSEATNYLKPYTYTHGLTDEQANTWKDRLRERGLIPYIQYPVLCAKCGKLWPEFFKVSDEEWDHYIQPDMRDKVICWECYSWIKTVIDEASSLG